MFLWNRQFMSPFYWRYFILKSKEIWVKWYVDIVYMSSIWPLSALWIRLQWFDKFLKEFSKNFYQYFLFFSWYYYSNLECFLVMGSILYALNIPIRRNRKCSNKSKVVNKFSYRWTLSQILIWDSIGRYWLYVE